MAKQSYICIDKNTGCSLRNLPSARWNDGSQKNIVFWFFAGVDRPANKRAIEHLASKGYTNIEFVPFNVEQEEVAEKLQEEKSIKKGFTPPKTEEEVRAILGSEECAYLDEYNEFDTTALQCLVCVRHCKQSRSATIYNCPLFEGINKD